jgi:spermidine synthase
MIDGFTTAVGNYGDLRVHKMLGYLPWLLHENPKSSLVIGFGMGVTADSLAQPGTDVVQCAELAPEVLDAGECFSEINTDVLRHPKFEAVIDDGRSFLLVTEQEFDIITSNAVHAKLSCSLYTEDFYELCRDRLKEGGIMCQWLPSNWMTEDEYKMLIRSFVEVFPHTSLWGVNDAHTLLLGTPEKVRVDFVPFSEKFSATKVQRDLAPWDLGKPLAFLAHYVADEDLLTDYVSDVPANTDDTPYVEFSTEADMRPTMPAMESIMRMRRAADASFVDFAGAGEASALAGELETYLRSQNHALHAAVLITYGEYDEALQEALMARRINPEHGRARSVLYNVLGSHISRAEALRGEGKLREAVELLREVLRADPGSPSALVELGLIYRQTGQLERAAETIRRAVEAVPNFAEAQRALGLVNMDRGRYEAAAQSLQRATEINPSDARAHYYLAVALRQLGRLEEARAALEASVQLAPRALPPRMELAAVYEELGRPGKAAAYLQEVLRIDPGFQPALRALQRLGTGAGSHPDSPAAPATAR